MTATRILDAIAARDEKTFGQLVADDVVLRVWRWDGNQVYRPADRAYRCLAEEWAAWTDPILDVISAVADAHRAATEYRIWTDENDRYVEHNRAVFVTLRDNRARHIDMYYAAPRPVLRRGDWIAPIAIPDDALVDILTSLRTSWNTRNESPIPWRRHVDASVDISGTDSPHPGANAVRNARFTDAEADRRIDEIFAFHRDRALGFSWLVGPRDAPADLGARLAARGMIRVGSTGLLARRGLDAADVPLNPHVRVEVIDPDDDDAIGAAFDIIAIAFNWPEERKHEYRSYWFDRAKNREVRDREITYLALLDDQAVAYGHLAFKAGVALLDGAATLPGFRGNRLYSTLLRKRLDDARARGYHIAVIEALPMSRRVVRRYRFTEYANQDLWAWMPVIDMDVIRSLIPSDDDEPDER